MVLPLDIGRVVVRRDKKVYVITLLVRDRVGILRDVIEKISGRGVPIINLIVSNPADKPDMASLVFFVDLTEKLGELPDLLEELRKVDDVLEVGHSDPFYNGVAIDDYNFPIEVAGSRSVIVLEEMMSQLLRGLEEKFGSAGKAFMFYGGVDLGRSLYEKAGDVLGSRNPETIVSLALKMLKVLGFGEVEVVELDKESKRAVVRVRDNIECGMAKGGSMLVRGMISGILSEYMGQTVIARETRCAGRGSPYCEFRVAPLTG